MIDLFEYGGQTQTVHQFSDKGKIELRKKSVRARKPGWLVITKLVGLVLMLVAAWILRPEEMGSLSGSQSVALFFVFVAVYTSVAHFIQPKANTDNLGVGGIGDDRFQYNDDINRSLLQLDIALAPGRFIGSTISDALILAGLLPERSQEDLDSVIREKANTKRSAKEAALTARVNAQIEAKGTYAMELDSAKYMNMYNTTNEEPVSNEEPEFSEEPVACN